MPDSTTRKVYFYRSYLGLNDAGEPLDFDPCPALAEIQELDFVAGENYLEDGDGNVTCCWVDHSDRIPCRVRLARVRRMDLPQVEEQGQLSPLDIPATSGIAEQVHIVFFDNNVVGFLYNHYGPRLGRFAHYLKRKAGGLCENLRFDALLRRDVLEELDRLREIRTVQLRLRRSAQQVIEEIDTDLGTVMRGAAALGDAERVELILRPEPYKRDSLGQRMFDKVWKIAESDRLQELTDRFRVKGPRADGQGTDEIDLLKDHLVSEERVVFSNERTRALDDASAFDAVEGAYNHLREDLDRAATVWMPNS